MGNIHLKVVVCKAQCDGEIGARSMVTANGVKEVIKDTHIHRAYFYRSFVWIGQSPVDFETGWPKACHPRTT